MARQLKLRHQGLEPQGCRHFQPVVALVLLSLQACIATRPQPAPQSQHPWPSPGKDPPFPKIGNSNLPRTLPPFVGLPRPPLPSPQSQPPPKVSGASPPAARKPPTPFLGLPRPPVAKQPMPVARPPPPQLAKPPPPRLLPPPWAAKPSPAPAVLRRPPPPRPVARPPPPRPVTRPPPPAKRPPPPPAHVPAFKPPPPAGCQTIYSYLASQPLFSLLFSYINKVPSVKALVSDPKANYTLLALTNQSFKFMAPFDSTNPAVLEVVLREHIVVGRFTIDDIQRTDPSKLLQRLAGQPVTVAWYLSDLVMAAAHGSDSSPAGLPQVGHTDSQQHHSSLPSMITFQTLDFMDLVALDMSMCDIVKCQSVVHAITNGFAYPPS